MATHIIILKRKPNGLEVQLPTPLMNIIEYWVLRRLIDLTVIS